MMDIKKVIQYANSKGYNGAIVPLIDAIPYKYNEHLQIIFFDSCIEFHLSEIIFDKGFLQSFFGKNYVSNSLKLVMADDRLKFLIDHITYSNYFLN